MISTPRLLAAAVLLLVLPTSQPLASAGAAEAGARQEPAPGAAGIGDPYFPLDGNGGIDVQRYRDPRRATASTTGSLRGGPGSPLRRDRRTCESFNLDFLLPVDRVTRRRPRGGLRPGRRSATSCVDHPDDAARAPARPYTSWSAYAGRPGALRLPRRAQLAGRATTRSWP